MIRGADLDIDHQIVWYLVAGAEARIVSRQIERRVLSQASLCPRGSIAGSLRFGFTPSDVAVQAVPNHRIAFEQLGDA